MHKSSKLKHEGTTFMSYAPHIAMLHDWEGTYSLATTSSMQSMTYSWDTAEPYWAVVLERSSFIGGAYMRIFTLQVLVDYITIVSQE